MLTALSVARESLIVEPQDNVFMASVTWLKDQYNPTLVWCRVENRQAEKGNEMSNGHGVCLAK